MNKQFEHHVEELIKLARKLFKYTLYSTLFFFSLLIFLLIKDFDEKYLGIVIFNILLIIVFLSESIYGIYLYKQYQWILTNYQYDKDKCLSLLLSKRINYDHLTTDLDNKNLSFSMKLYMHSKKAYDILNKN